MRRLAAMFVLIGMLLPPAGARADEHRTVVRAGDRGQAVVEVQFVLVSHGYVLAADGIFGPRTERAVRHWQRANGLRADGIVGSITWRSLTSSVPATVVRTPVPPSAPSRAPAGDVEAIIRDVWPDHLEDEAVRIAKRESRLIPTVRNACCFGLFQIYFTVHRGWLAVLGITSSSQLFDARTNATAALALYQRNGWAPWAL